MTDEYQRRQLQKTLVRELDKLERKISQADSEPYTDEPGSKYERKVWLADIRYLRDGAERRLEE